MRTPNLTHSNYRSLSIHTFAWYTQTINIPTHKCLVDAVDPTKPVTREDLSILLISLQIYIPKNIIFKPLFITLLLPLLRRGANFLKSGRRPTWLNILLVPNSYDSMFILPLPYFKPWWFWITASLFSLNNKVITFPTLSLINPLGIFTIYLSSTKVLLYPLCNLACATALHRVQTLRHQIRTLSSLAPQPTPQGGDGPWGHYTITKPHTGGPVATAHPKP